MPWRGSRLSDRDAAKGIPRRPREPCVGRFFYRVFYREGWYGA